MTYEQALKDWKYLWAISPAHDMTGGYEDQGDLDRMLHNPTKTQARRCLSDQIRYWFRAGPSEEKGSPLDYEERQSAVQYHLTFDDEVDRIHKRHC